jgi:uncharacterized protein
MSIFLIDEISCSDSKSNNTWLLYAPEKNFLCRLNSGAARVLGRAQETGIPPENPKLAAVWSRMFTGPLTPTSPVGSSQQSSAPQDPNPFLPTNVTLFLTNKCQLRCIYCFAHAGERQDISMSFALAKDATDFIIKNALTLKQKNIHVAFHGGGEPAAEWQLMKDITDYTKNQAQAAGLSATLSAATNGILSEEQCTWMATHFKYVTISLDGPPDIQDRNRPLAQGCASSLKVEHTLICLARLGLPFNIRATITENSVERQEESIAYLAKFANVRWVHFQPMYPHGRGKNKSNEVPNWQKFVRHFIAAKEAAAKVGIHLSMAGIGDAEPRWDGRYCGATSGTFAVTPLGSISACYEVVDAISEGADTFIYGKHSTETHSFEFDYSRLERLKKLNANNRQACQNCFCLPTCVGNCPNQVIKQGDYMSVSSDEHCQIIRALTLHQLQQKLK